jgi:hypothetical protein
MMKLKKMMPNNFCYSIGKKTDIEEVPLTGEIILVHTRYLQTYWGSNF